MAVLPATIEQWWLRIPVYLRRWSLLLSAAWTDGIYLTALPIVAVLLPLLALLIGFGEGVSHWSFGFTVWEYHILPFPAVVFVQMLPLLYFAAVAGALSAWLGLLVVIGYTAGDWFLAGAAFPYPGHSWLGRFLQIGVPQLITYLLFFMLAVLPVMAARVLAGSLGPLTRLLRPVSFWFNAVLVAALQGLIVYAWTMSAPMVIRPVWTWAWRGQYPPLTVPYFTSVVDPGLPVAVIIAAMVRAALMWWARQSKAVARQAARLAEAFGEADRYPGFMRHLPQWARVLVSALVVTLLLAGFIKTLWLGIEMFIIVAVILMGRAFLLPRVPGWTAAAARIPLLFRWLAVVGAGYLAAQAVFLAPGTAVQFNEAPGAFAPERASIVLGLIIAALLLPDGRNASGRPINLPRFGRGPARAAAGLLLFIVLVAPNTAFAVCADSFCCFVNNFQAIMAMAALLVMLSTLGLFLLPEAASLALLRGLFGVAEGAAETAGEVAAAESRVASEVAAAEDAGEATKPLIYGARGVNSGRLFDPDKAGGPIQSRSVFDMPITHEGIDQVENHIDRFGYDEANQIMVKRLRQIANGEIEPSLQDQNFYTHELDEYERYKNLGWQNGQPLDQNEAYELWNNAHTAALEDYGLKDRFIEILTGRPAYSLYHQDAMPFLEK